MPESKPPPRTLKPDDERVIQVFLERASAIVLDHQVLDARHWSSLVALAEELGLSDEQLRATVNDLRDRGVIKDIDLAPPRPPRLPEPGSQDGVSAPDPPQPEADFALTPPPPEPLLPPPPLTPAPAAVSAVDRFIEQANGIIAKERGFTPRTHALLAVAAGELGLSEEEAATALHQLQARKPATATKFTAPPVPEVVGAPHSEAASQPPPTPPSTSLPPPPPVPQSPDQADDAPDESVDARRWRVQGQPPPEPPPAARKPVEIYRDYLQASLAQMQDGIVPRFSEKKFLKHGTGVLSLSSTFARHIFEEELAAKQYQLESAIVAEETSEEENDDTLSDPDVQIFLDRSVPILAAHRGITVKSRVLLNALAEELGLSQEQVENAIVAAQFRAGTVQELADSKQQERLEGFRALLHGTLISLPRKVVTADIEHDLLRHGEELHGLDRDVVLAAIREVCSDLEISQISVGKARQHIELLIDTKLTETPRLPMEVRLRITSEGEQWGLTAEQVVAMIDEKSEALDRKRRAEQQFSEGALYAAGFAVLIVIGLFMWIAIGGGRVGEPVAEVPPDDELVIVEEIDETKLDVEWWDTDLHADVSNARYTFESHREAFKQLESRDPLVRRSAYGRIVRLLTDGSRSGQETTLLTNILSHAYELEPDDESARHLFDQLLSLIPRTEDSLFAEEDVYAKAFIAAETAPALLRQAKDERRRQGAILLGRAIDYTVDVNHDATRLNSLCAEQTAKRLFTLLVALAETNPSQAARVRPFLNRAITIRTALDTKTLVGHNTDFLLAYLRHAEDSWRDVDSLLDQAIRSEDAANAVRLLAVYEETENGALREHMQKELLQRADVDLEEPDVATVATAVRKALGVSGVAMADDRTRRFLKDAREALRERAIASVRAEEMIRQIVEVAYLNAIGCAAANGEAGSATFDRLSEKQAKEFLEEGSPFALAEDEQSGLEPSTHRVLNDRLRTLASDRTAVGRADAVLSVARLSESIADLTPGQAETLAKYMLRAKRIEEHRIVVEHAPALARWNRVRLAVADRLVTTWIERALLQQLISAMLGREYEMAEGVAGREAVRVELMQSVLASLAEDDGGGGSKFAAYDQLSAALNALYRSQAAVYRVAVTEGTETPTSILPLVIEHVSKNTPTTGMEAWQRQWLTRVSTELQAIDYLAGSDLERQVLLERSWLRLLAIQATVKRPQRRAQAEALLTSLAKQDGQAANVLHQLRDGQRAILKMWVLWNTPE